MLPQLQKGRSPDAHMRSGAALSCKYAANGGDDRGRIKLVLDHQLIRVSGFAEQRFIV